MKKFFLPLAATVVALDQITKEWILRRFPLGFSQEVWPVFSLTHVKNTGAAFGLFPNANAFFVGSTLFILVMLAWMHRDLLSQGRWAGIALGLVWGGALGNLVDRLRLWSVTDFLLFYWRGWQWPAFNVADSAICVGLALLVLQSFSRGGDSRPVPDPARS
jgi:signal peptidase II